MKEEPAFQLVLPDATLIGEGGLTEAEVANNQAWRIYGINAGQDEVRDFYLSRWSRLGYVDGGGNSRVPTQYEEFACAMHNAENVMRLAFYRPEAAQQLFPQSSTFRTTYRVAIVEKEANEAIRPCSKVLP